MGSPLSRGGQLRMQCAPSIGTTVELLLPQAATAASVNRKVETPEPAPLSKPCRVMIVDDDSLVMTGTARPIEDLEHTRLRRTLGPQGLSIARKDLCAH